MAKSNVERVVLVGKCKWAKVHEPNINEEYDISEYSLDLMVTDEHLDKLKAKGMQIGKGQFDTKVKTDDNGDRFLTFKQPTHSRAIIKGGKLVKEPIELKPPVVVDKSKRPTKELIGNGSEVRVVLNVLKSEKYDRASFRLAGVQIIDLVPFKSGGDIMDCFEDLGDGGDVEDDFV